jgi:hypothetical protein
LKVGAGPQQFFLRTEQPAYEGEIGRHPQILESPFVREGVTLVAGEEGVQAESLAGWGGRGCRGSGRMGD